MAKQRWFRIALNVIVLLAVVLVAIAVLFRDYALPEWTWDLSRLGFGETTIISKSTAVTKDLKSGGEILTETTTTETLPGKTLWDWLELLIIPTLLGIGVLWFNRLQREREIRQTEDRAKIERELAIDRQREDALQNYLDKISELLLEKELLDKNDSDGDPILVVAQVRTGTTLRMLDKDRRDILLQFLRDANLASFILKGANLSVTDLSEASLRGAFLNGANLSGSVLVAADLSGSFLSRAFLVNANLSGALMSGADLSEAVLINANLSGAVLINANLSGASLVWANLSKAVLNGATVNNEQFAEVRSLEGATMPDGTLYDGRFDKEEEQQEDQEEE